MREPKKCKRRDQKDHASSRTARPHAIVRSERSERYVTARHLVSADTQSAGNTEPLGVSGTGGTGLAENCGHPDACRIVGIPTVAAESRDVDARLRMHDAGYCMARAKIIRWMLTASGMARRCAKPRACPLCAGIAALPRIGDPHLGWPLPERGTAAAPNSASDGARAIPGRPRIDP